MLSKALISCPRFNKLPNLVTLGAYFTAIFLHESDEKMVISAKTFVVNVITVFKMTN